MPAAGWGMVKGLGIVLAWLGASVVVAALGFGLTEVVVALATRRARQRAAVVGVAAGAPRTAGVAPIADGPVQDDRAFVSMVATDGTGRRLRQVRLYDDGAIELDSDALDRIMDCGAYPAAIKLAERAEVFALMTPANKRS